MLRKHGIKRDSSVFPIGVHPEYGIADAPLEPHWIDEDLLELPMSVIEVMSKRLACTGGGYFRLYPYALSKRLIASCNRRGRPAVFYTHPWDFDPGQPRQQLPPVKYFRHYNNLDRTLARLDRLLLDFEWGPMGSHAEALRETMKRPSASTSLAATARQVPRPGRETRPSWQ